MFVDLPEQDPASTHPSAGARELISAQHVRLCSHPVLRCSACIGVALRRPHAHLPYHAPDGPKLFSEVRFGALELSLVGIETVASMDPTSAALMGPFPGNHLPTPIRYALLLGYGTPHVFSPVLALSIRCRSLSHPLYQLCLV
jgi:hypothetical protein